MDIDIQFIHAFLLLAEHKSFTKVAQQLNVTQPAISQKINKLEQVFSTKLFIRQGKKVELTPVGDKMLVYAKQILIASEEMLKIAKETNVSGQVTFGLPEDFANTLLAEVLSDFSKIHSNIDLRIECDLTLNLLERFERQEFDIILVKTALKRNKFAKQIMSSNLEWVGINSTIKNVNEVSLVLSPEPCIYRSQAIEILNKAGIKCKVAFSSSSYASNIAAVKAGIGITVLPKNMIPYDLKVINSPFLPQLKPTTVSILTKQHNSPAIESLAKFIGNRV